MKFKCETKELCEALVGVSRAVYPGSHIPVLQGILFNVDDGQVCLKCYDLEMSITTAIQAVVDRPGTAVLHAKIVCDMVKGLYSDEVSFDLGEDNTVHIVGGITEYHLPSMRAEDYPELPEPGADPAFEIDGAELAGMIQNTIYAVSTDEMKPVHTGEFFAIKPGEVQIVALDGFRLAMANHPVMCDREISVVVPSKAANEVVRLMGEAGEAIRMDVNDQYVVFSNGRYTIMSRLLEGEFLKYDTVIPTTHTTSIEVDVFALEKAITRCSVIITERNKNPLRITFGEDISLQCQTILGRVSDSIDADITGEKVEVGLNYRYLLDALRNARCERVILRIKGPMAPIVMVPAEGDDFLALLLPVRYGSD